MRAVIFTLLLVGSLTASAQQDAVRSMMNRSETSIYKSQKQMISANVPQKQKELSLAIKYQALAVKEFKNNNVSLAVCYTAKAREYTIDILTYVKLQGLDYYLLNNEEKNLVNEHTCFDKASDLGKNISPGIIDESVLLSPDKLAGTYKISIN